MKGSKTLDGKPFRYGGILHNYDWDIEDWQKPVKNSPFKKCHCCDGTLHNIHSPITGETWKHTYPYCASFKVTKGKHKGNYQLKILCRECAYAYGKGVIEMDGQTYYNPNEFNEKKYKEK